MKNVDIAKFKNALDEQAKAFLNEIDKESRIDSKKIHPNEADFPIFHPANRDYYEYEYYEGVLEWRIREYLISNVFYQWFELMGCKCHIIWQYP